MRNWMLVVSMVIGSLWVGAVAVASMSSAHYEISSDYIGVGGGVSTSTSYSLSDAISNLSAGIVSSTTYEVQGGFVSNDAGLISLILSSDIVSLGTLSSASVKTGSVIATVTTDQSTGFTLSIGGVSGTSPAAVADGMVTAGVAEYGLSVSNQYSLTTGDVAVVSGLNLASATVPVTNEPITLAFKASVGPGASAASYNQSIALTAATNF